MPFYEDSDLETESPSNEAPLIIAPWSQPGVKTEAGANFNIPPVHSNQLAPSIPEENMAGTYSIPPAQSQTMAPKIAANDIPASVAALPTFSEQVVQTEKVKAPKKVDTRDIEYQKALEEYEIKCKQHEADLQAATDALDEAIDQYDDGKEQMRRQQYDWEKQWKDHLKAMKAKIAELKKVKITPPKK